MTLLGAFDEAVREYSARLEALGVVTYARSENDRPKRSAHLIVETSSSSVELLLWESGECELNYAAGGAEPSFDHYEIASEADVARLVGRVIELAAR